MGGTAADNNPRPDGAKVVETGEVQRGAENEEQTMDERLAQVQHEQGGTQAKMRIGVRQMLRWLLSKGQRNAEVAALLRSCLTINECLVQALGHNKASDRVAEKAKGSIRMRKQGEVKEKGDR